jgi:hypothetical protein
MITIPEGILGGREETINVMKYPFRRNNKDTVPEIKIDAFAIKSRVTAWFSYAGGM